MSRWVQAARWLKSVGIATAVFATIAVLANPARAMAAGALDHVDPVSATRAVLAFLAVWLIASLRVGKSAGRWRLEFSPAVVCRTLTGESSRTRFQGSDGVSKQR